MLYRRVTITVCFSRGFKIIWVSKVCKSRCSLVQPLRLFREQHTPPRPPNTGEVMYTQRRQGLHSAGVPAYGVTQIAIWKYLLARWGCRRGGGPGCAELAALRTAAHPLSSSAPAISVTSWPPAAPPTATDRENKIHTAIKHTRKHLESCPHNDLLPITHTNVSFRSNSAARAPVRITNRRDAHENTVCNQVTNEHWDSLE